MGIGSDAPNGHFGSVDGAQGTSSPSGVTSVNPGTGITITGPAAAPIVGNAGVLSVNGLVGALTEAADSLIPIVAAGTTLTQRQLLSANWTLGICRVYAVDGVNGNDANAGFADPATSSAADYAIACAAAGAAAKKTLAGLGAIFPRQGRGRLVEIVVAAATYTDAIDTVLAGAVGYAQTSALRGTATNATAGVIALDGSAADCTVAGAQLAAGMNATGYNPDAATSAVLSLTLVGGGAAAFAAEPARPLGMTVRFDAATTTAAQRGKCYPVVATSGATVTINASIARVATDVIYLEDGGVVVPSSNFGENAMPPASTTNLPGFQLVGVRFTGTSRFMGGRWACAKCSTTGMGSAFDGFFSCDQAYNHPVRGALTVGSGMYNAGTWTQQLRAGSIAHYYTGVGITSCSSADAPSISGGSVLAGLQWNGGFYADSNNPIGSGSASLTSPAVRVIGVIPTRGGIDIEEGSMMLSSINVTGAGALPAIKVLGCGIGVLMGADKHGTPGGSTGNNDVGIDLTGAYGCNICWSVRPTVTGALGDVRQSSGAIVTWAALAALGTSVDANGNRYSGP